jgi:hypothetical protein
MIQRMLRFAFAAALFTAVGFNLFAAAAGVAATQPATTTQSATAALRAATTKLQTATAALQSATKALQAIPSASPTVEPLTAVESTSLSGGIWLTLAFALAVVVIIYLRRRDQSTKSQSADRSATERDLETTRVVYGFWLIVASLLLTLAVVILTVNVLRTEPTANEVAIITAVTGVIGTLIAAFFGVQAAGAGRAQALDTLKTQIQASQSTAAPSTLDPAFGPHAGNTKVSVSGNGFTGASAVNFGDTPGTDFQLVNDGVVQATTPPASPGKDCVDVAVVFPGATPVNKTVGTFYYYTVVLTDFKLPEPSTGDPATGTISIRGFGLKGASQVRFGPKGSAALTMAAPELSADGSLILNVVKDDAKKLTQGQSYDVAVIFPVSTDTNEVAVGKLLWDPSAVRQVPGNS